jgi:hypothetical protein
MISKLAENMRPSVVDFFLAPIFTARPPPLLPPPWKRIGLPGSLAKDIS